MVTKYKQHQFDFWTNFQIYLVNQKSSVKFCSVPQPQSWAHHLKRSTFFIQSICCRDRKVLEIRAELWLNGPKAIDQFAIMKSQYAAIDHALGFPLNWDRDKAKPKNEGRTLESKFVTDFTDPSLHQTQFNWLQNRLEKMHVVLPPLVPKM